MKLRVLLTGGAGFIGSNIAQYLLRDPDVESLVILDNFSSGSKANIQQHLNNPKLKLVEGDITSMQTCVDSMKGCNVICHQAALGSVPRSFENPIKTNSVNVDGFLNILQSAVELNINKLVFASSSSVYGDSKVFPKSEEKIGTPLSPYAVSKLINELYATVFARNFGMDLIGLRYFNVFGPRQNPAGDYAAVIPLFIKAALTGISPIIYGDGTTSRDFTFVDNIVNANVSAMKNISAFGEFRVYNVGCGREITLNELWSMICDLTMTSKRPIYKSFRPGDVKRSIADISKIKSELNFNNIVNIEEGISKTIDWYKLVN
jgi:UDP-N-acetylglucosamine/UDP-N-acetylgalactosamine 4-epimerase